MTPAKKPFQVGDRVAVYDNGRRQTGTIGAIDPLSKGFRVDAVDSQQCVAWNFGWFHLKQLRRLKKKSKVPRGKIGGRMLWVLFNSIGHAVVEYSCKKPLPHATRFIEAEDQS